MGQATLSCKHTTYTECMFVSTYSVQCTVHCTLYTVHCTQYSTVNTASRVGTPTMTRHAESHQGSALSHCVLDILACALWCA